jgi:hypothetical protein
LSIEAGDLTPSMKLRRKKVVEDFAYAIFSNGTGSDCTSASRSNRSTGREPKNPVCPPV